MDWTMTLKDDFGVIAWTWRAGNYLSLFLLLSLFSIPVQSDFVFPKGHHFSWKTGKCFIFFLFYFVIIQGAVFKPVEVYAGGCSTCLSAHILTTAHGHAPKSLITASHNGRKILYYIHFRGKVIPLLLAHSDGKHKPEAAV